MFVVIQRVTKALVAAAASGVASWTAYLADGVTAEEWGKIAAAVVGTALVVWAAPKNKT